MPRKPKDKPAPADEPKPTPRKRSPAKARTAGGRFAAKPATAVAPPPPDPAAPPRQLGGDALARWRAVIADQADADGPLREVLCRYCELFGDYRAARRVIAEEGTVAYGGKNGAPYPHPAVQIMHKAHDAMERIEKRLGLGVAATSDGPGELEL